MHRIVWKPRPSAGVEKFPKGSGAWGAAGKQRRGSGRERDRIPHAPKRGWRLTS